MTDAELAAHIAHVAGDLLLSLQRSGLFQGKALGRAGDRTANAFIMEALRANRPDDAVLYDEEKEKSARSSDARRVGKEGDRQWSTVGSTYSEKTKKTT